MHDADANDDSSNAAASNNDVAPLVPLDPAHWVVLNDGVMGGRSRGGLEAASAGMLAFAGVLDTNGGGFSSIRSRGLDHALVGRTGVRLRVRGDGRRYACDVRAAARIAGSGVSWKAHFETTADEWRELALPFTQFVPTWRGRVLTPAQLDGRGSFLADAGSIGFTIADGIDGPFRLDIAAVGTYR